MSVESVGDADLYALLEIDPEADGETIENAIRQKQRSLISRQNHPKREVQRKAEDELTLVRQAKGILLDPDQRRAYDARRFAGASLPQQPGVSSSDTRATTAGTDRAGAAQSGHPGTAAGRSAATPPPVDWTARAALELQGGNLPAARYAAREATDRHPSDGRAWAVRGSVSQAEQRYGDAVFEFTEASRFAPGSAVSQQLAQAYEGLGDTTNAAAAFQRAVSADPAKTATGVEFARFWLRQGQPQRAISLLEPLLAGNPGAAAAAGAPDLLGWSILDAVESSMAVRPDGAPVFTTAEQISAAQPALHRALSLPLTDAGLIDQLRRRAEDCEQSLKRGWSFPPGGVGKRILGWFALFLFTNLLASGIAPSGGKGALQFLALLLVIGAFVLTYRKPRWQVNARRWR